MRYLLAAVVGQGADLLTAAWGIGHGTMVEFNPIYRLGGPLVFVAAKIAGILFAVGFVYVVGETRLESRVLCLMAYGLGVFGAVGNL